jgi:hypothetical protein
MESMQSRLDRTMLENAKVSLLGLEIEDVRAKLDFEKEDHAQKIEEIEKDFRRKSNEKDERWRIELINANSGLKKREDEILVSKSASEKLGDEVTRYTMIIEQLREDLADAKAIRPEATPREPTPRGSVSSVGRRPSETGSQSESPSTYNTFKEKELQMSIKHLSEMLSDSEVSMNQLREQETVCLITINTLVSQRRAA